MVRYIFVLTAVLFLIGVQTAGAEIYKYKDAQGVVRYTYDLAEVPEDQRPKVQTYEEETSPEAALSNAMQEDAPNPDSDETESGESAPLAVDEKKIDELTQKKKDLDQEFAALMEEKFKLLKEKERLDSLDGTDTEAAAAYDTKAKELNRKIVDYQKRLEAFQKEAEAVNKALETTENPQS